MGDIFPGGNFHGSFFSGGFFPKGIFPDTIGDNSLQESVFFNTTEGKDGNRVRIKGQRVAWSHEDTLVLWDTYIRSKVINARSGRGYTYWVKDIWNGLDRQARSHPSLVLQVNRIKKSDYLSLGEKEMIEERIRGELNQVNRDRGTTRQEERNG